MTGLFRFRPARPAGATALVNGDRRPPAPRPELVRRVGPTAPGGSDGREPQQRPQARIDLDLLPLRHRRNRRAPAEVQGQVRHPQGGRRRQGRSPRRALERHWVQPDRLTVAEFLLDEWLPTQRPPTLEESTYASSARNIGLHVVPYVGAIRLQQLTPMDLNALCRTLLDSGRRPPGSPVRRHDPAVLDVITRHKGEDHTWQQVADAVAGEFPDLDGVTRHAVASAHRRVQ